MPNSPKIGKFSINETDDYGVVLTLYDLELADQLDDFINDNLYVFTQLKFGAESVDFYFGQASCADKIREIVRKFMEER